MKTHPELLSTADQIRKLAESLKKADIIAFDTEFIRETTFYPIVEIIQVATDSESWLVDAQAFKKGFRPGPQGSFNPGLKPLLDIFEDKSSLKIAHAIQGDQECLFTSFGVLAAPTLDTAVAASLCGYGEGIGLGKLLKAALDVTIKKGHARTNWSVRPLPAQLIEYAHADVEHLVRLGKLLLEQLDKLGRRPWALELSSKWEERSLYEPPIEEIASKLARGGRLDRKGYAALVELVRWREARVRQLNLPRRWVADDAVLVDLAHVRPKDMAHLSAFRGLNKGELKNSGEQILAALKAAAESGEAPPKDEKDERRGRGRVDIPTTEESQVLDLIKCYVGMLADKHRIAAKHLMTSAQLLPLLRAEIRTADDFVKAGILGKDAAHLIGDELVAFIHGHRALSVEGNRIKVVETASSGKLKTGS
ncbi:MAG TPA: HRDC domain-containing protein [Bdellovibrionota bacterium]|nr:HRDC domain-containing protein [Bdellovibrionota bacterium]